MKNKLFPALTLTAALCGPAAGCAVEGDLPEVEVTQHDVQFAALPAVAAGMELPVVQTYEQKEACKAFPKELFSQVKAVEVALTAHKGVTDLDFLKRLKVTMQAKGHVPAGAPTSLDLIDYVKAPGDQVGAVLRIRAERPAQILPLCDADAARFVIEMQGGLPQTAWSVDVGVRFSGSLK